MAIKNESAGVPDMEYAFVPSQKLVSDTLTLPMLIDFPTPLLSQLGVTTITSPKFFSCFARIDMPIELIPSSLITRIVGKVIPQFALDTMFRYFRVFLCLGVVFVCCVVVFEGIISLFDMLLSGHISSFVV